MTNEKNTNKVLEFLQSNNIDKKYKQQYKTKNCSYKSDSDYSNFDWTSLYVNKILKVVYNMFYILL